MDSIRFDWDVLYLKSLRFSDDFIQPNFLETIERWGPIDDLYDIADGSNKWNGRPDNFDMVRTLAIHRDTLTQTNDDYECVLRHFFPRLQLLMVLIDDDVAIKKAWGVKDNDFREYEGDWGDYPPRCYFTQKSTGPFTVVSEKNRCYEEYVITDIKKRFEREEQDYKDYTAPDIRIMGCWLPPGVNIPLCGRYPQLQDDLQDVFPGELYIS